MNNSLILYSPAGVVAKAATVRQAAKYLGQRGYDVTMDASALLKFQRFAGDDVARLSAIHRVAQAQPSVALATRGGYGLMRLLDQIDWPLVLRSARAGTRWVGYSDCTLLQLAALAKGFSDDAVHGEVGGGFWHGPMAAEDFGRMSLEEEVDDVTEACFLEAMSGELEAIGFRSEALWDGLEVKGRLWGGNLTLVNSLLGTPYWPKIKNGILFVEDVNEHPYRVERNLLQLLHAGVLDSQKAVLLGEFSAWKKSPLDRGYNLKTAINFIRQQTKTPIITGLPFGHVPTKISLPQGKRVQLVVQGRDVMMGW